MTSSLSLFIVCLAVYSLLIIIGSIIGVSHGQIIPDIHTPSTTECNILLDKDLKTFAQNRVDCPDGQTPKPTAQVPALDEEPEEPEKPEPPIAKAGGDKQVTEKNQVIELDGSGSTPQKDLKYMWTKKEGPSSVVLSDAASAKPTFTFPTTDEFDTTSEKARKVIFQLQVTNENGTDTDDVEIIDGCFLKDEKFRTYRGGPWSFEYAIVEKQGLVLRNINAGQERVLDSISVPHFNFVDARGNTKIVRFCDPNDQFFTIFDKLEPPKVGGNGVANLKWKFSVDVGKNPDGTDREEEPIKGQVTFEYDIPIFTKAVNNCELNKIECYRLVPKLNYNGHLDKLSVFYRLDYGYGTGLAPVKDTDNWPSNIVITSGFQNPFATHETAFLAVKNGQPGEFDNIHTGKKPGQGIFIPGCRYFAVFDCVHMHWRWSEANYLDPMIEPSTGKPLESKPGTPNLVSGQTIAIAIVKNNPGEEDPDDISRLLNGEHIATTRAYILDRLLAAGMICPDCVLVSGGDPIVWYVASIDDRITNTFFRHGIFVLDTKEWGTQDYPLLDHGMNDETMGSRSADCFPFANGTPALSDCNFD